MSTVAGDTSPLAAQAPATHIWPDESLTAFRRILTASFEISELEILCHDCGEDPENIGGATEGKEYWANAIITHFHRRGRLTILIEAARRARPMAQWDGVLSAPAPAASASPSALGAGLRKGVEALTQMIRTDPRALATASKFQSEFQLTTEQIATLSDYKALHDQLHTLDIQCYKMIWRDAGRFPADERVAADMIVYADTLENAIADLREIAKRPSLKASDTAWLPNLEQALADLRQAIDAQDAAPLQKALGILSRILRREPSSVNQRLHAIASTLRLDQVYESMRGLYSTLAEMKLDAAQLASLAGGVEAFNQLTTELPARVEEHDQWQRLDNELTMLERDVQQAFMQDKERWHDLRRLSEPLWAGRTEAWAITFRARAEQLDAAVAASDAAKIAASFLSYRSSAANRFYRVDDELHRLCESLRESSEPMQIMIALLKGESNG